MLSEDIQKQISASLLRLRMKSPFFATLALFAQFRPTQLVAAAATDGKDIYFNPEYLRSLPPAQQDGLLLHEVLHAALLHAIRRGVRDAKVWNIAADIVVNGMIMQQGCFELPLEGIRNPVLEHLSVEEIYELLQKDGNCPNLSMPDLLDDVPGNDGSSQIGGKDVGAHSCAPLPSQECTDSLSQAKQAELTAHWRNALQQAAVVARTVNQGQLPAGMERELALLTSPQLDWRAYLWRYLVQTPTDFVGFDRRFIGRGLYLESLVGESVKVFVAVDTSGSIDNEQLQMFLSELRGILHAYPHIQCDLYFADAEAYGPYEPNADSSLPSPQGGGGTSFIPFFIEVEKNWDRQTQAVCIYLTDGYGDFPLQSPELPVLWVVTPGGLNLSEFPFGEAVRLLSAIG